MPDLDYNVAPLVGPRFYEDGGRVMFEHVVDRANVIGPRLATEADKTRHAGLWAAFSASAALADEQAPAGQTHHERIERSVRRPGRPRKAT